MSTMHGGNGLDKSKRTHKTARQTAFTREVARDVYGELRLQTLGLWNGIVVFIVHTSLSMPPGRQARSPANTLAQLRFTSLTVISLREDLHLQECAHAGRTEGSPPLGRCFPKELASMFHKPLRPFAGG